MFDKIIKNLSIVLLLIMVYFIGATNGANEIKNKLNPKLESYCEMEANIKYANSYMYEYETMHCTLLY